MKSSIEDRFYGFVDSMDRKGVPLGKLVIALRNKGIPPLPAFAVFVLLFAFVFASIVTPLLAPAELKGTVYVTVLSDGGLPLENAKVTAAVPDKNFFSSAVTDAKGIAKLMDVPMGELTLSASLGSAQSNIEKVTVIDEKTKYSTIYLSGGDVSTPRLTISTIDSTTKTPVPATVVITFENGTEIIRDNSTEGTIDFLLDSNSKYTVKVMANGYSDGEKLFLMGSSDNSVEIPLVPRGLSNKLALYAKVEDEQGNPLPDIKVSVYDFDSNSLIGADYTGASGTINKVDVGVGKSYYIVAKDLAGKYVTAKSEKYEASTPEDVHVTLSMGAATTDNTADLVFTVMNKETDSPLDATITLYEENRQIDSRKAVNGRIKFSVGVDKVFTATIYASGFLPQVEEGVSAPNDIRTELSPSFDNSGKVKVKVLDNTGLGVSGVKVVLLDEDGMQLGLPVATTAIDGITDVISDVTLSNVQAYATYKSREGNSTLDLITVEGTGEEENITLMEVRLSEPKAKVKAVVTNYLSKKGIYGATVRFLDHITGNELGTCKTNSEGMCEAEIAPGDVVAEVSAAEYKISTSDVKAAEEGASTTFSVSAYPLSMGLTVQLDGVYDMKGKRVTSVIPAERYRAVFRLVLPNVDAEGSGFFVRVGAENVAADDDFAAITNIDAPASLNTKMGATYTPPVGSYEDINATSTTGLYKWAEVNYAKGKKGTTTIAVQVKISPNAQDTDKLDLYFRGSYKFANELFRFPEDAETPIEISENATEHPMYADARLQSLPVSTDNTYCTDNLCYQLYFINEKGTQYPSTGFDIDANKEFKLHFKLLYQVPKKPLVSLNTDSNSVEFKSVQMTSPNKATASARIDEAGQTLAISLGQSSDQFEGDFIILSKVHDKAIPLTFAATDASETELNMGVTGAGALHINVSTNKIYAAKMNKFTVSISDMNNIPIGDAKVTLSGASEPDPFDTETYEELGDKDAQGKDGVYSFEGVEPYALGTIKITADRVGYKSASVLMNLSITDIISVDVQSFIIPLAGEEPQAESPFTLTNNLQNEVNISIDLQIAGGSMQCNATSCSICKELTCLDSTYTNYLLSQEEVPMSVIAKKNANKMAVIAGSNTRQEQEMLDGKIIIYARVGTYTQKLERNVKINHNFVFKGFDNEWEPLESEGLEFSVSDSRTSRVVTDYLNIENMLQTDSPYAYDMQVNYQISQSLDGYINTTPSDSLIVSPSSVGQWTITANAGGDVVTGWGCIEKDTVVSGEMSLTAYPLNATSEPAFASTKKVPITIMYEPSGECAGGWGIEQSDDTVILSELARDVDYSFCVKNQGPAAINVSVILTDPDGLVDTSTMRYAGQTFTTDWAIIQPDTSCSNYTIPISVNASVLDSHNCIANTSPKTVTLKFNANSTDTGKPFNASQTLTITVQPEPSDDCPWKKAQIAQKLFSGLIVSGANDVAPNGVFNFKGSTSNNWKLMTVVNNFDENIQVEMKCGVGGTITCRNIDDATESLPFAKASLKRGEGSIFNCSNPSTQGGACALTAMGCNTSNCVAYNVPLETKTVAFSVEGCKGCTGTPLGLLAPPSGGLERVGGEVKSPEASAAASALSNIIASLRPTATSGSTTTDTSVAPEDVMRCTKYFCNSDQAFLAIAKATEIVASKIVEWRDDPANANNSIVKAFCEDSGVYNEDKTLKKSITVQMANTRIDPSLVEGITYPINIAGISEMTGCGVYIVSIEAGICEYRGADPYEWAQDITITVKPSQLSENRKCEEKLHNAALLMPYEPGEDNLRVHVGLAPGTSALHFLRFFKENQTNTVDIEMANATQNAMFGEAVRMGDRDNTTLRSYDLQYSNLSLTMWGVFSGVLTAYCAASPWYRSHGEITKCIASKEAMYVSCIGTNIFAQDPRVSPEVKNAILTTSTVFSVVTSFVDKLPGPWAYLSIGSMLTIGGVGLYEYFANANTSIAPGVCNCGGSTLFMSIATDPGLSYKSGWIFSGIAGAIAAGFSIYDMSQGEIGFEWIPLVGPLVTGAAGAGYSASARSTSTAPLRTTYNNQVSPTMSNGKLTFTLSGDHNTANPNIYSAKYDATSQLYTITAVDNAGSLRKVPGMPSGPASSVSTSKIDTWVSKANEGQPTNVYYQEGNVKQQVLNFDPKNPTNNIYVAKSQGSVATPITKIEYSPKSMQYKQGDTLTYKGETYTRQGSSFTSTTGQKLDVTKLDPNEQITYQPKDAIVKVTGDSKQLGMAATGMTPSTSQAVGSFNVPPGSTLEFGYAGDPTRLKITYNEPNTNQPVSKYAYTPKGQKWNTDGTTSKWTHEDAMAIKGWSKLSKQSKIEKVKAKGGELLKGLVAAWAGGQLAQVLLDCDFNDPQVILASDDYRTTYNTPMNHIVVSHEFQNSISVVTPSVRWVTANDADTDVDWNITSSCNTGDMDAVENHICVRMAPLDTIKDNKAYILWVHSPTDSVSSITQAMTSLFG